MEPLCFVECLLEGDPFLLSSPKTIGHNHHISLMCYIIYNFDFEFALLNDWSLNKGTLCPDFSIMIPPYMMTFCFYFL